MGGHSNIGRGVLAHATAAAFMISKFTINGFSIKVNMELQKRRASADALLFYNRVTTGITMGLRLVFLNR